MGEDDLKPPFTPPKASKAKQQKVKLGEGDIREPGEGEFGGEESGMYMGPGHPVFNPQAPRHPDVDAPPAYPFPEGRLPQGAHPPGARIDPITPFGEGVSGEPDNDELQPPPNRPPPTRKNPFGGSGNKDPFGGAPFFK